MRFLAILFTYTLCHGVSSMADIFDVVPKDIDASQGRRAILRCSLKKEYSKSYQLSWLHDGKAIRSGERYEVTDGQLHFNGVDKELDSGTFQCLATNISNPNDKRFTGNAALNIKWLNVGAVSLKTPDTDRQVLPGASVVLKCDVAGNPRPRGRDIKWYRDGVEIKETLGANDVVLNKDRLTILKTSLGMYDGAYSCCTSQSSETKCSSPNYNLFVRDVSIPVLVTKPKNTIVQPSGDAWFHCGFDSTPLSVIKWYNNDDEQLTNKSREGEGCRVCVYPNGTLIIKRVKERHEGRYTCRALGPKGNVTSASAELSIAYIKSFSGPAIEQEFLKIGSNIEKVCGVPDASPPAKITWMKNGIKIAVSDGSSSPRVTVSGNTLVITSAQSSDQGDYQCVAQNIAGNVTKKFRFLNPLAPEMRSQLLARTENEGADVNLKCDVSESPAVTYTWYKDSSLIKSDGKRFIIEGNQLTIKSISIDDAAVYKCTARNPQGETGSSARIRVNEQLKLDPEPQDTCIEIGKRSEIVCVARGIKNPIVNWTSQEIGSESFKVVSNGVGSANKSLVFLNPKEGDSWTFFCTARGGVGTPPKSKAITVTVGRRPRVKIPPESPTFFTGSAVRLDCGIVPLTLAEIKWLVYSNSVTKVYTVGTNSRGDQYTVMNNGSFYVKSAVTSDTGVYTCSYKECGFEVHRNVTLTIVENDGPITTPLGPDETDGDDKTPEYQKIQTVALAVGGSVAYLILTITIIIYCRRKKRHKKSRSNHSGEVREEIGSDDEEKLMINGSTKCSNEHSKKNGVLMVPVTHLAEDIENLQYDPMKLEKVTVIGCGEFGEVFLSKAPGLFPDLSGDILVMVKEFDPNLEKKEGNSSSNNANGHISDSLGIEGTTKPRRFEFNREIRLLQLADHENVVRLLGVCSKNTASPTNPDHLITEYLEWGILKLCLQASRDGKIKRLSKHLKMKMCCQIAAGLEHLTKLGLAHQDVATRNCVISSKMLIKLSVLSLTKEGFENEYFEHKGRSVPIRWMAPEALFNDALELKSDVWSFGVTCWEIFNLGTMPYSDLSDEQLLEELQGEQPPTLPSLDNSKRITSLISKCCQHLPGSRPEFHQIVKKLQSILGLEAKAAVTSEATSPNETDVDATGPLLSDDVGTPEVRT